MSRRDLMSAPSQRVVMTPPGGWLRLAIAGLQIASSGTCARRPWRPRRSRCQVPAVIQHDQHGLGSQRIQQCVQGRPRPVAIPTLRQTTGRLFGSACITAADTPGGLPSTAAMTSPTDVRPPERTARVLTNPRPSPAVGQQPGSVLAGGAVAPLTDRPLAHLRSVGQLPLGQPAFISPPSPILCPSCASFCAPLRMVTARTAGDSRAHDKPPRPRARGPHAPAHHPAARR